MKSLNSRQEAFALAVASGRTQFDAHKIAGYSSNKDAASILASRPQVKARIRELREQITEAAKQKVVDLITPVEVMERVGEMARGKPADKLTHKVKLAALQTAGDLLHMGKDDKGQPINITISTIDLRHLG
jgi:phage terminase small subunit